MNGTLEPEFRPDPRAGRGLQINLREFLGLITLVALAIALAITLGRLHSSEQELMRLRREAGYLQASEPGQIAAARVPVDQPLTYRLRIRVPNEPRFRVAYSTLLPRGESTPDWYGALAVPPGESSVTVRIASDPRDGRWKITTLVDSDRGTERMSTVLPEDHVRAFRGSHDVVNTGVGRKTQTVDSDQSLRLLDDRWLVGEGSLLLYGDRPPERDQLGVYVELQPDRGPL